MKSKKETKENSNIIFKFGEYLVSADKYQYILIEGGNMKHGHRTYYSTLSGLLEAIYDTGLKDKLLEKERDLEEIIEVIKVYQKNFMAKLEPLSVLGSIPYSAKEYSTGISPVEAGVGI